MRDGRSRIAERVRARRLELGYASQRAFADEAGVGTRMVAAAETGERIGVKTQLRLERALGWESGSIEAILNGSEPTSLADDTPAPRTETSVAGPDTEAMAAMLLKIYRSKGYDDFSRVLDVMVDDIDSEFGQAVVTDFHQLARGEGSWRAQHAADSEPRKTDQERADNERGETGGFTRSADRR